MQYSWWSTRSKARDNNIGWRIDALYTHKNTLPNIIDIRYLDTIYGSDHCPLMLITTD